MAKKPKTASEQHDENAMLMAKMCFIGLSPESAGRTVGEIFEGAMRWNIPGYAVFADSFRTHAPPKGQEPEL